MSLEFQLFVYALILAQGVSAILYLVNLRKLDALITSRNLSNLSELTHNGLTVFGTKKYHRAAMFLLARKFRDTADKDVLKLASRTRVFLICGTVPFILLILIYFVVI